MSKTLVIGTRGSELALWQANHISGLLNELGFETRIQIIVTSGDRDQVRQFGQIGTKGLFVKELELALLDRSVDLCVHSLKDLPTDLPEGLALSATPKRETPYDALVSRDGLKLEDLPQGASLASGSLRRTAQARALRPDLRLEPLRGNVPTRIRKIREGLADATFLAAAGLWRLGLETEISQVFPAEVITPPMGQGALGIETRAGDLAEIMAALDHAPTRLAVEAERAFIGRIGGGCRTPAGVIAEPPDEAGRAKWRITGMIASEDGASLIRRSTEAPAQADQPTLVAAALALANDMLADANDAIRATLNPKED